MLTNIVDFIDTLRTPMKEETLDISPVERVNPLMISGIATLIGNRIGSVWHNVVLILEEMVLLAAMEVYMLPLT